MGLMLRNATEDLFVKPPPSAALHYRFYLSLIVFFSTRWFRCGFAPGYLL
jgi:hypothetical protein